MLFSLAQLTLFFHLQFGRLHHLQSSEVALEADGKLGQISRIPGLKPHLVGVNALPCILVHLMVYS